MRKLLLISGLIVLLPVSGYSSGNAGRSGFRFLNIPLGAKQTSMGSLSMMAPDVNIMFGNPSLAAVMNETQAGFTYNRWLAGISQQSFAFIYRMRRNSVGMGVIYMNTDSMTGYDIDESGDPVKIPDFKSSDMCGVITLGRDFGLLAFGANFKLIRETISDYNADTFAFDAAATVKISRQIKLSLAGSNMGSGAAFIEETTPLPSSVKVGFSYRPLETPFLIAAEIEKPAYTGYLLSIGQEHWIAEYFAVRFGYRYSENMGALTLASGIRAGCGFKWNMFNFDYSFSPMGKLGNSHQFSLVTGL